jgi:hypothetical protein
MNITVTIAGVELVYPSTGQTHHFADVFASPDGVSFIYKDTRGSGTWTEATTVDDTLTDAQVIRRGSGGSSNPSGSYTGYNGNPNATVALGGVIVPGVKLTVINSTQFTVNEPSNMGDFEPGGLLTFITNNPADRQTYHPGFGSATAYFANKVVPAGTNYEHWWTYHPPSGPDKDGPHTIFERPEPGSSPTARTSTSATVVPFGPLAPCVSALFVQVRQVGSSTITSYPATPQQPLTLPGLTPDTEYQWRVRIEFPAMAGGDGFAHGTWHQFRTEPVPPPPCPISVADPTAITGAHSLAIKLPPMPEHGETMLLSVTYVVNNETVAAGSTRMVEGLAASSAYTVTVTVRKAGCPDISTSRTFTTEADTSPGGGSGGGGGNGGNDSGFPPDAPGEIEFDDTRATTIKIVPPPLPARALSIRLERRIVGTTEWLVRLSGITSVATVTDNTQPSTRYAYSWVAVNAVGTTRGPISRNITDESDDGGGSSGPGGVPTAPGAPGVAKICATQKLSVTSPAWASGVIKMELQREILDSSGASVAGTQITRPDFASSGATWLDGDVLRFTRYRYRARATNQLGASTWGPWSAPVELRSATMALTLTVSTPSGTAQAPGATISNRVALQVNIADAASGACAIEGEDVELLATLDGKPITLVWTRASSARRDGGIYVADWDTRDFASGLRTLAVAARSADCCWQEVHAAFTLSNTQREGTQYSLLQWGLSPLGGGVYTTAAIALQQHPLSANLSRRYWISSVLSPLTLLDLVESDVTPEAKAKLFAAQQLVRLQPGQAHELVTDPLRGGQEWHAVALLDAVVSESAAVKWDLVTWALQFTPAQRWTHYETGCEVVGKIRPMAEGKYFVFASSPFSEDNARVFLFDGSGLHLVRDLGADLAGDAEDVALLDDKLWVIRPEGDGWEIFVIDLDSGQATLNIAPRGELRSPRYVELIDDVILGIFVDETLPLLQCSRGYDMTFGAPRLVWSLDEAVHGAWGDGAGLAMWSGSKYFRLRDGVPVLARTFDHPITGAWFDEESDEGELSGFVRERVFLVDGSVWQRVASTWTQVLAANPQTLWAGASWRGGRDRQHGVAGGETAQLVEELADGSWMDARQVPGLASEGLAVSNVASMMRFFQVIEEAQGDDGLPGAQTPAIVDERLLVGTGADGLLCVLQLNDLSSQGALLASKISHPSLDPYSGE